jgi:hypothetical protein
MARTVVDSGTKTADGSEQTIRDETSAEGKVYDASIDLGLMASGDAVEIRLYAKLLTGGTLRRVYYRKYYDSQDSEGVLKSPIVYIPAITVVKEWKLTLKQTAGTNRNYDWTIYSD